MTTIQATRENLDTQVMSLRRLLDSGRYTVTFSITPTTEMSLSDYLQTGIHMDDRYGPFTDTQSLFTSLDA